MSLYVSVYVYYCMFFNFIIKQKRKKRRIEGYGLELRSLQLLWRFYEHDETQCCGMIIFAHFRLNVLRNLHPPSRSLK